MIPLDYEVNLTMADSPRSCKLTKAAAHQVDFYTRLRLAALPICDYRLKQQNLNSFAWFRFHPE